MIGAGIFAIPDALALFGWTSSASWLVVGIGTPMLARLITLPIGACPEELSMMTICGDILGLFPGHLID